MKYVFYIDQFFIEHLLIGYLLFAASDSIGKLQIPGWRLMTASLVNATVMTLCVCLSFTRWRFLGLSAACLTAFGGRDRRRFCHSLVVLFWVTGCFGGIAILLMRWWSMPVLAAAALGILLLRMGVRKAAKREQERACIVELRLFWEQESQNLHGIVDTGNQLREPVTKQPVSIVEEAAVAALIGENWEIRRGIYLIPYHSIGTEHGMLRGVSFDKMEIRLGEQQVVIQKPLLAVYEGKISADGCYQVILHPEHLKK